MNATVVDPSLLQRLRAKLSEYDIFFLCDKTGSMNEPVKSSEPNGTTRWNYMQEVLRDIIKTANEIDDDGITLGFFSGSNFPMYENVTSEKAKEILNSVTPGGGTYLGPALQQMFAKAGGTAKKDLIVIMLDGEVADRDDTIAQLVAQANKQDNDNACTVLFVQVGDDAGAKNFLKYLDDNLVSKHGAKFDIVDTKTVDEIGSKPFEVVLAEAIVD